MTKALIRTALSVGEFIFTIPSFFSIVHFTNTGVGFGLLKDKSSIIASISILIIFFLLFYLKKREKENAAAIEQYTLAAISAGALSNLIDRLIFGTVTDFIYFHFWPAFNIADSAITIGAIILIIIYVKKEQSKIQA